MKYDFDEVIERRGTYCTQWDYIEDRFGEKDLLPFSISDTDFRIPKPISNTKSTAIRAGIIMISRRVSPDIFNGVFNAIWKRIGYCTVQVSCIPFLFCFGCYQNRRTAF